MKKQVLSLWFFTTISGLFACIVLSVRVSKSHKMVGFLFSMTFGGLCSHQLVSCGRPKFLHKHQWIYWPNLSCRFRYSVGANMGQSDTRWSIMSVCVSHTLHFNSASFSNTFAWKFFVSKLWSCTAMMVQWRICIRVTSSEIRFYDFTMFIPSPLLFGVFGFGNIIGVYNRRIIVRRGPDPIPVANCVKRFT